VINPTAGHGRTRRLLARLRAGLAEHEVAVHVSTDADDGIAAARAAFARGEGVVACGGDGTIAAIAGTAADCGGTIAVVPTGAGNDFARHLGIDRRRPLDALDLLASGTTTSVDLLRVTAADGTSVWSTTVANTGFDAEANRWANGVRALTGTPLYVAAMLRTVATYRPQPIVVRVDEHEWRGRAWLVAAGNTRGYAGGMMITPGAEIDDGLVDVCIIGATSVAKLVARFPSVFRGTHVRIDEVTMLRGKLVELTADGGDVPLELWASGERVGALPGSVEVVPEALRLVVPRGAPVTRP
jgi:YegS/Rv2252/BmrU family lipid kinase